MRQASWINDHGKQETEPELQEQRSPHLPQQRGPAFPSERPCLGLEAVPHLICLGPSRLHFSFFLGPHLQHMEVPRLGIESELQLPAYTTATSVKDPSHVGHLYHSSPQYQIFSPLSEARDRTHILMDTGRMSPLSHDGNSQNVCLKSRTLPYFCLNSSLSKKIYLFLLTKVESQVHTIDLFSDWR